MKRIAAIAIIVLLAPFREAPALDYTQLNAVKLLRSEKRFDEAIKKLEVMATQADDADENFHYLDLAIEIASGSLKNADRALSLANTVKDPARRDFANLRVFSDFKRYDEALARVRGKKIDEWPVRCRGSAYAILADIDRLRGDDASAQGHRLKAIASPGAEAVVRGNAATDAAQLYLKQGDTRKAEEMFRQALDISPAYYAWRNTSVIALSRLLIQTQRTREAVKLFEGMDFSKVENINARGQLLEASARAFLAAGKKIKAVETFDVLLQSGIPDTWKDRLNKELDHMAEDF
jgi:tetratricopeptide (TPR) repeat protein